MAKRQILLLAISLLLALTTHGQDLKVRSMSMNAGDLSASTQRRLDINKKPCALVKVQLPLSGAVFEGNIIKPTAYKTNEYWVYMTEGSKELHIKHPNYQTLVVNFADYGIKSLQSLCTYTLSLSMLQGTASIQLQKLTIDYTPANAMVVVDSEPHQGNGHLEFNLPVGSHDYQIMAIGYETAEGSVKLTAGQPRTITEHLVAKKQPNHQAAQTTRKEQTAIANGNSNSFTSSDDAEIEGKTAEQIRTIAYNYREGKGGKSIDYAKAMKYFRTAVERGNTTAMVDIGFMYSNGQGVTKDYAEAAKWYRKAAEQGLAWGQNNLGNNYRLGQGVEKDYAEAVKWYRKAAGQGHASGQLNLGYMYRNGLGVTKDEVEAVKWYRKAAEQGDAIAQCNLGICYQYGKGVTIDLTQAKYWYEKAAAQGYEKANKQLEGLK